MLARRYKMISIDNKKDLKHEYITNIVIGILIAIIILCGILGMIFDKEKENIQESKINNINNKIDTIEQWIDSVEKNGINIR
jgi:NADH:ubiquinone oxidoreductase subunit 6 (subunit J)